MKKLALTSLMLLMAIKSVSACTYMADPLAEEKSNYSTLFFLSLVFLILANIIVYYLKKKEDILVLILIVGIAIVMIPVTFFGVLLEHCDFLGETLRFEFIVFVVITIFHLGLWITNSRLELPSKKGLDLPSIKP